MAGRAILAATAVLPVKFHLTLSGPVPRAAAWTWGSGTSQLVDAVTGHAPNVGGGNCDDVPGPYTPPPPANVVSTAMGTVGVAGWVELTFDQAVILNGFPPDSTILFNGIYAPAALSAISPFTVRCDVPVALFPGSSWAVLAQPSWTDSTVAFPQSGTL